MSKYLSLKLISSSYNIFDTINTKYKTVTRGIASGEDSLVDSVRPPATLDNSVLGTTTRCIVLVEIILSYHIGVIHMIVLLTTCPSKSISILDANKAWLFYSLLFRPVLSHSILFYSNG